MTNKVQAFYDDYTGVMHDIQEVIKEERSLWAVAGDTATIKQQQEEFKQFQIRVVSVVSKGLKGATEQTKSADYKVIRAPIQE